MGTGLSVPILTPISAKKKNFKKMSHFKQQAHKLLKTALDNKNANFRDGQWEAIESLVRKRKRLLVVQRTGWGKSIVYFLSTRLLRDAGEGPTVVISPLLALIRNQVEAAERLGLNATTINSDNTGLARN
jgi:ATP-dependent DNA helicase RecQ